MVYLISLGMYSRVYNSLKPVMFSMAAFPVMLRHMSVSNQKDDPPLWLCICFGFAFYLAITGTYQCIHDIVTHFITSAQIIQWMYRMYGLTVTVVFHWRRVKVPFCMMTLWGILFLYNSLSFLLFSSESVTVLQLFNLTMALTCNSVLSMTSCCFIIYKLSGYILNIIKRYHHEDNIAPPGDPYSSPDGLREGFGFFFLGLYTGLSSSKISRKLVLLELIFYLIISALARSMFEITEPVLLGLASQPSIIYRKHLRVLSFCISLLGASIYLAVNRRSQE